MHHHHHHHHHHDHRLMVFRCCHHASLPVLRYTPPLCNFATFLIHMQYSADYPHKRRSETVASDGTHKHKHAAPQRMATLRYAYSCGPAKTPGPHLLLGVPGPLDAPLASAIYETLFQISGLSDTTTNLSGKRRRNCKRPPFGRFSFRTGQTEGGNSPVISWSKGTLAYASKTMSSRVACEDAWPLELCTVGGRVAFCRIVYNWFIEHRDF